MISHWLPVFLVGVLATTIAPGKGGAEQADDHSRPAVLREAFDRLRRSILTANASYRLSRSSYVRSPVEYVDFRCAGDDVLHVFRGDENGVTFPEAFDTPLGLSPYDSKGVLHRDGDAYEYIDNGIQVIVRPIGMTIPQVNDLRMIGLSPSGLPVDADEFLKSRGEPPLRYQLEAHGDQICVTGTMPDAALRWWLDPGRDLAITRTQVLMGDLVVREDRYELALYDGVWFPERVETLVRTGPTADDALEQSRLVEMIQVEFNRPEHPPALTLAHLGVEPGMFVDYMDGSGRPQAVWDGIGLTNFVDFSQRLEAGNMTLGPKFLRARETARSYSATGVWPVEQTHGTSGGVGLSATSQPATAPTPAMRSIESEWERYTREFIERYRLDAGQRSRALLILANAQQRARQYLAVRRDELAFIERHVAEVKDDTNRRVEYQRRRAQLLRPIDGIFEQELKERLDRLPTRAQRAAAEQATTRPSR